MVSNYNTIGKKTILFSFPCVAVWWKIKLVNGHNQCRSEKDSLNSLNTYLDSYNYFPKIEVNS